MKSVTCRCDAVVEVDAPDELDLDADPGRLPSLYDGSFLSATCPTCGSTVLPEMPIRIRSASKGLDASVVPETERVSVYRGKVDAPEGAEILVGYRELFERMRMLRDGLEPRAVEVVRYCLMGRAEESDPEAEVTVFYDRLADGRLEFHVVGLRPGQTGVVRLPFGTYEKALADLPGSSKAEPFKTVFKGRYKSIRKLELQDREPD